MKTSENAAPRTVSRRRRAKAWDRRDPHLYRGPMTWAADNWTGLTPEEWDRYIGPEVESQVLRGEKSL